MSTSPLMSQHRIAITDRGGDVVLAVGNSELVMPYETALQVSQWLRIHAKQAKRRAGDVSRHWSAIGIMEDAGETERRLQRQRMW
jgi:hypothetical protein